MKKLLSIGFVLICLSFTACSDCFECNAQRFCKESGTVYTDNLGQPISWDEYKAMTVEQCQ